MKKYALLALVAAAMLMSTPAGGDIVRAQEKDVPKMEVGAQFSSLSVNEPDEFDFGGTNNFVGFGGRFTYNLTHYFAVEAEGNFYPNKTFATISTGGRVTQAQFGVKVGKRFDRFGVFAKARPGFVSFGEALDITVVQTLVFNGVPTTVFNFGTARKTYFSTDVGGVLEFYPSRHLVTRFDAGDTIIRYGRRNDIADVPVLISPGQVAFSSQLTSVPAETKHNFGFSAGVGYRFGGSSGNGGGSDDGGASQSGA
ncbi:MAG: outer membrane beta-barrel protein, partial [Pyrinomonadaceae bacterium]